LEIKSNALTFPFLSSAAFVLCFPLYIVTSTYIRERMYDTGPLYQDVRYLFPPRHKFQSKLPQSKNTAKGSPLRVLQTPQALMIHMSKATCAREGVNSLDVHEHVWGKVNSKTLKICKCDMYMRAKNTDENGLVFFANGDIFQGHIRDCAVDGEGTYYFLNGDSMHGTFKYGMPLGDMTYVWANGDTCFARYNQTVRYPVRIVQLCLDNQVYNVVCERQFSVTGGRILSLKHFRTLQNLTTIPDRCASIRKCTLLLQVGIECVSRDIASHHTI